MELLIHIQTKALCSNEGCSALAEIISLQFESLNICNSMENHLLANLCSSNEYKIFQPSSLWYSCP